MDMIRFDFNRHNINTHVCTYYKTNYKIDIKFAQSCIITILIACAGLFYTFEHKKKWNFSTDKLEKREK